MNIDDKIENEDAKTQSSFSIAAITRHVMLFNDYVCITFFHNMSDYGSRYGGGF